MKKITTKKKMPWGIFFNLDDSSSYIEIYDEEQYTEALYHARDRGLQFAFYKFHFAQQYIEGEWIEDKGD